MPSPEVLSATALTSSEGAIDWFGRPVCCVKNGVVIMLYRAASSHTSEGDASLRLRFSTDYCANWTADNTFTDGSPITVPFGTDNVESYILVAPNGDILILSWKESGATYLYRSTDNGKTWSAGSQISFGSADDTKLHAIEHHYIKDGVLYVVATDDLAAGRRRTLVKDGGDSGASWSVHHEMCEYADFLGEAGFLYEGDDVFFAVFRDQNESNTYTKRSQADLGATDWNTEVDITTSFKKVGRPRIATRTDLQANAITANGYQDTIYVLNGYYYPSANQRINAIWIMPNRGADPYIRLDMESTSYGDAGYGSLIYDPDNDEYVYITYRGTDFDSANLVAYRVRLPLLPP